MSEIYEKKEWVLVKGKGQQNRLKWISKVSAQRCLPRTKQEPSEVKEERVLRKKESTPEVEVKKEKSEYMRLIKQVWLL